MMKSSPVPRHAALIVALALLLPGPAIHAAAQTWLPIPASGNWNSAGNWSAGGPPDSASATAIFYQSATTSISVSGSETVNSIVFGPVASAFRFTIFPPVS